MQFFMAALNVTNAYLDSYCNVVCERARLYNYEIVKLIRFRLDSSGSWFADKTRAGGGLVTWAHQGQHMVGSRSNPTLLVIRCVYLHVQLAVADEWVHEGRPGILTD